MSLGATSFQTNRLPTWDQTWERPIASKDKYHISRTAHNTEQISSYLKQHLRDEYLFNRAIFWLVKCLRYIPGLSLRAKSEDSTQYRTNIQIPETAFKQGYLFNLIFWLVKCLRAIPGLSLWTAYEERKLPSCLICLAQMSSLYLLRFWRMEAN